MAIAIYYAYRFYCIYKVLTFNKGIAADQLVLILLDNTHSTTLASIAGAAKQKGRIWVLIPGPSFLYFNSELRKTDGTHATCAEGSGTCCLMWFVSIVCQFMGILCCCKHCSF